jgi:hypothetical protein
VAEVAVAWARFEAGVGWSSPNDSQSAEHISHERSVLSARGENDGGDKKDEKAKRCGVMRQEGKG